MAEIEIQRIVRHVAEIRVIGTTPLVISRFSEKAKQEMLDKMQGRRNPKGRRDPNADYERAFHRLPGGEPAFPAGGFKGAIVGGSRYFNNKALSQVLLRQSILVLGESPDVLVRIDGPEAKMSEDYVRVAMTTDLRYRPRWDEWAAVLRVVFIPSLMDLNTIVALVEAAGMGGIGEGRPASRKSNTGMNGTWVIDTDYEIKETIYEP